MSARRAAWDVLGAYLVAGPAKGRLGTRRRPFPPPELPPRDRAAARALATGVVRRLATLDAVLREASNGREPRPAGVRAALLLGAYELLFEPEAAAHAAVHEAVGLARRAAGTGGARFANAILRRVARERMLEAWVARPEDDAATALWARYYSLPETFCARRIEELGPLDARAVFEAFVAEPWLTLRANVRRTSAEELAARLAGEGIVTRPGFHPKSLLVARENREGSAAVLECAAFRDGWFSVQDSAQTETVDLLDLTPGLRVLDLCAAPGSKTTAIAEALHDQGEVIAADASPARLAALAPELARLGLACVRIAQSESELLELAAGGFDRVLVDAPCSNTGVLHRRVEARWRFDPAALPAFAEQQLAILATAASMLRPGGRLVYATCSLEREENEAVAQTATAELGLRLVSAERTLPVAEVRDGGGAAVLVQPG